MENQPKIGLKNVEKSIKKSIKKWCEKSSKKWPTKPPMERFGVHFGPSWMTLSRGGGSFFRTCSRKGLGGYPLTESGPILGRFWSVLSDLLGHQALKIAIWGPILMPVGCHLSILGHHFANLFSKMFLGTSLDHFSSHFFKWYVQHSRLLVFSFDFWIWLQSCCRTLTYDPGNICLEVGVGGLPEG